MTPKIRQATESDLRFVHSSWHTNHWRTWAHKYVSRAVYGAAQDRHIDLLLARCHVTVAYFPEVPDEVLGWAAIEPAPEVLHYAYVKGTYRRMGIGRGLVEGSARWYTQYTDAPGRKFADSVGVVFNPYKEYP